MTIEQNLTSIAESLKIIADALSAKGVQKDNPVQLPVTAAFPLPMIEAPTPAPVKVEAPTPAPVKVEAPVVPNVVAAPAPAPIPVAPVVVPVAVAAPAPVAASPSDFNLTTFVLDAYKKLGPIKGAGIQAVLQQVGAKNINDVKPEQYAAVKAGVEALLAA